MKTNDLSDRKLKILSALAVVAIGCLCWSGGTPTRGQSASANLSPQVQEVVKLTQAKMTDDVIISYVKNSGAAYNLSADDILYLNGQGVSQAVISTLLASKSTAPAPAPAPLSTPSTPAPPLNSQVSPYPGQAPTPGPIAEAPPEPAPGSDITLSYFQAQLAPYGNWVEVPGQGLCWKPTVASAVPDWRPYFNEGHWIYTEDGWSWESDYPWGQYAFHYGRWFMDARYGWLWAPGYTWGPAWVSWRQAEGAGYFGWAPLPSSARYEVGVGLMWDGRMAVDTDFGLAPDMYVFVPFDHFWERDYVGFRAPLWRTRDLFRVSIFANHYGFVGGHFVFGLDRERVGFLTHHEVRVDHLLIRDAHILRGREIEHTRAVDFHNRGFDRGHEIEHGREVDHAREVDHSREVGGHDSHDGGSRSSGGFSREHDGK